MYIGIMLPDFLTKIEAVPNEALAGGAAASSPLHLGTWIEADFGVVSKSFFPNTIDAYCKVLALPRSLWLHVYWWECFIRISIQIRVFAWF